MKSGNDTFEVLAESLRRASESLVVDGGRIVYTAMDGKGVHVRLRFFVYTAKENCGEERGNEREKGEWGRRRRTNKGCS